MTVLQRYTIELLDIVSMILLPLLLPIYLIKKKGALGIVYAVFSATIVITAGRYFDWCTWEDHTGFNGAYPIILLFEVASTFVVFFIYSIGVWLIMEYVYPWLLALANRLLKRESVTIEREKDYSLWDGSEEDDEAPLEPANIPHRKDGENEKP